MARIDNLSNFLTDVATSIKAKTGSTETLTPAEFDTAIAAIEGSGTGGITPVGTITITENGDYDVTNYAGATVNVEGSAPEPTGTIDITENGEHSVAGYATANVAVPVGITPEGTITLTENGEHDITNYAKANVDVEVGVFPEGALTITSNGEHDVTNYAKANVDIEVGVFPEGTLTITQNGLHTVTNYEMTEVNVPVGVFPEGELEITSNGTHDVTNYASTKVNVPLGVFPEGTLEITDNGTFDVTNYENATVNIEKGIMVPESVSFKEDSWETIIAISEAGLADQYYKIGDVKNIITVDSTDNDGYYNKDWGASVISVKIIGFSHYTLADNTTKRAGLVLMAMTKEDDSGTNIHIDGSFKIAGGSQFYGWPGATRLRNWLRNTFCNALPAELRNAIKTVKVETFNGYSSAIVTSNETIFLPSITEVGYEGWIGAMNLSTGKEGYTHWLLGNPYDRFKKVYQYEVNFWLRSQGGRDKSHHLAVISGSTKEVSSLDGSQEAYVCPIFCI